MTSTEQPDQQEYGMAKASTSQQQGPSHKVEDEKLSGGRVLVVSSLDGKDGLKGGKNGRRRGRFIILGAQHALLNMFGSHQTWLYL